MMGIVVEFYSVDPDIVALAGSADSNPMRLGEALAAVRAAEPEMADGDDLENGAQAVQVGYLPPMARILAELSRHHGRLLTSVPVNSLVSEVLWTMLSSVGADLDLDQGVLQAVVLSDAQVQVIAALPIDSIAAHPVTIAIADAAIEALSEANWVRGNLIMIVA
jgi:hypothetical protein